jgi:cysteinyl-tRNA synthetase
MANFWIHGGLLNFDGRKMSKSLGNFEPLSAMLERHDPQAIRLTFLTTGYSKVMNFTEESLASSMMTLERLKKIYRRLASFEPVLPKPEAQTLLPKIDAALSEDMNTSVALAELLQWTPVEDEGGLCEFQRALWLLGLEPDESWLKEPEVVLPANLLDRLHDELGAEVPFNGESPEQAIQRVITVRQEARARKDFAASDRLRDALARCGIAIKDSKEGTTWTIAG